MVASGVRDGRVYNARSVAAGSALGWSDQLELACHTLSRSHHGPAMVIQVTAELDGIAGKAMPLLLQTKRLAAEHRLKHEAHLAGRVLSVRLSVEKPIL